MTKVKMKAKINRKHTESVLSIGKAFTLECLYDDCKCYEKCKKEKFSKLLECSIVIAGPDLHIVRNKKKAGEFSIECSKYMANKDVAKGMIQCSSCGWVGNKKDVRKVESRCHIDTQWDPVISYMSTCPRCHMPSVPCV